MKIEVREEILRPREEVFATLSRPDMYLSKWARGVHGVKEIRNNHVQDGRSFKIEGRDLARKVYWSYDVTASEPDAMFAGRASGGPVSFSESFHLESLSEGGTAIIHRHEIEPSGMFLLAGPLFKVLWPRLMRENLRNLKRLVEKRPARSS